MSLVGYSPWGLKNVRHNLVTKQQQQKSIHLISLIDSFYAVSENGLPWARKQTGVN